MELIDTAEESVKYAVCNQYGQFLLQFNRGDRLCINRASCVESDHIAHIPLTILLNRSFIDIENYDDELRTIPLKMSGEVSEY